MALSDIQDRLKNDPETIHVDFAGEERPFLFSTLGIERAKQKAEPIIPKVISIIQRVSEATAEEDGEETLLGTAEDLSEVLREDDLRNLTMIVWSGFLTFNSDISLEEVQLVLTPGRIMRYGREIAESVSSFVQEMEAEGDPAEAEAASDEVKN